MQRGRALGVSYAYAEPCVSRLPKHLDLAMSWTELTRGSQAPVTVCNEERTMFNTQLLVIGFTAAIATTLPLRSANAHDEGTNFETARSNFLGEWTGWTGYRHPARLTIRGDQTYRLEGKQLCVPGDCWIVSEEGHWLFTERNPFMAAGSRSPWHLQLTSKQGNIDWYAVDAFFEADTPMRITGFRTEAGGFFEPDCSKRPVCPRTE